MEKKKSISDDIAIYTVRTYCKIGGYGSGAIFTLEENPGILFVVTAQHCIKEAKTNKGYKLENIIIQKIYNPNERTFNDYQCGGKDQIFSYSDRERDMALIVIADHANLQIDLAAICLNTIVRIYPDSVFLCRGYPKYTNNEESRNFALEYKEKINSNDDQLLLSSQNPLDSYYAEALDNVAGLSGGAVFQFINNVPYLLGIVVRLETMDAFVMTQVSVLSKLLSDNGYVPLKYATPEAEQDVVESYLNIEKNNSYIADRAEDKIGQVSIIRTELNKGVLELMKNRLMVIHGHAGIGKSAFGKNIVLKASTENNLQLIALTGEQLCRENLSSSLGAIGIKTDLDKLFKSPLAKNGIIFWIESLEKLLETDQTYAFSELLRFQTKLGFPVVVTIRSYMLQQFQLRYRWELPKEKVYFPVSALSETELGQVTSAYPELKPLVENKHIRTLIKVPYYLKQTVKIIPFLNEAKGEFTQAEFKKLMWQHIVDDQKQKRGIVFEKIAVKRAKEMLLFTDFDGDAESVNSLLADNIIQMEDDELGNRIAPFHDILEDWALVRHLKRIEKESQDVGSMLGLVGKEPAMRRAFRMWLAEKFTDEVDKAIDLSRKILFDAGIEKYWKDDLVISVLKSGSSHAFIEDISAELLLDDAALIKRFVHLLRTGCKVSDDSKSDLMLLIPTGSGWASLLKFINKNIQYLESLGLLPLFLIQDWAAGLNVVGNGELPEGSRDAGLLLIYLHKKLIIEYRKNHSSNSGIGLDAIFEILVRLTPAILGEMQEHIASTDLYLDEKLEQENETGLEHLILKVALMGLESEQLCRFFPDLVIKACKKEWLIDKEKERKKREQRHSIMWQERDSSTSLTRKYGLQEHTKYEYGQLSAYQTPVYWLLRYHPTKGIDFVLELINYCFTENAGRNSNDDDEVEIALEHIDGYITKQFGSNHAWQLYRGSYNLAIIPSILMALERFLYEMCSKNLPETNLEAKGYIRRLIRESNNVAITAVISSTIQAFPNLLDEDSVVILSQREFFEWDSTRSTHEMLSLDFNEDDPRFTAERNDAAAQRFRKAYFRGLISFTASYMLSGLPLKEKIYGYLDKFHAECPPNDLYWRKMIYEMDPRNYVVKSLDKKTGIAEIQPAFDEEITKMLDEATFGDVFIPYNVNWARNILDKKEVEGKSYENWRVAYTRLLELNGRFDTLLSPGLFAALGIIEFRPSLKYAESNWCIKTIVELSEEFRKSGGTHFLSAGLNVMDLDPVLTALPLLLKEKTGVKRRKKIEKLIISYLISGNRIHNIKNLITSFRDHAWGLDYDFAQKCWHGIINYSQSLLTEDNKRNLYSHQKKDEEEIAAKRIIKTPVEDISFSELAMQYTNAQYLNRALLLLPFDSKDATHVQFLISLFRLHMAEIKRAAMPYKRHSSEDFNETRNSLIDVMAHFILLQDENNGLKLFNELIKDAFEEPFEVLAQQLKYLEAIPKMINRIINTLDWVYLEENCPYTERFWTLWIIFKERCLQTNRPYMMDFLFLPIKWKETAIDWKPLRGKKQLFRELIVNYGYLRIESSVKLLSGIGCTELLPEGINWLAGTLRLSPGLITKIDSKELEKLVNRAFYRHGKEIKSDKELVADFLFLLDLMIDFNSSIAFLIKEYFISYK